MVSTKRLSLIISIAQPIHSAAMLQQQRDRAMCSIQAEGDRQSINLMQVLQRWLIGSIATPTTLED